jgi:hypothetical protein
LHGAGDAAEAGALGFLAEDEEGLSVSDRLSNVPVPVITVVVTPGNEESPENIGTGPVIASCSGYLCWGITVR